MSIEESHRVVGFHGRVGHDQTPALRGEVLADPETADSLDWGCGTRTPAWVHAPGRLVFIFGQRERDVLAPLSCEVLHKLLQGDQVEHLGGGLVACYCTPSEIHEFKATLAEVVRDQLAQLQLTDVIDRPAIIRSAFWLSRTASVPRDFQLASGALRRVGHEAWRLVLPRTG